jgi:acyl-homoserine-lactone acylase
MTKIITTLLMLVLIACSDSSNNNPPPTPEPPAPPPEPTYELSAEIKRTEYGIPHITAEDWKSLGYGFGYAYSQDNYCVTMKEMVYASGRSSELLGEGQGNTGSDFLFRYLNGDDAEFEERFVSQLPQFSRDLAEGFARGMNRYREETGDANLPEGNYGCRDAQWLFEVTEIDLFKHMRREALRGSSDNGTFRNALLSVEGPDEDGATGSLNDAQLSDLADSAAAAVRELQNLDRGSNALAVGSESTQNGGAVLLGNPHQPWFGAGAWYQAHLTLPGEYDVAGAALHGFPFIGIGFNKDVAWTHTVSLANRFSLYELKLNPENPLQYEYEGEMRDITPVEVVIDVLLADGTLEQQSFTFYESHFGPVVNLKGVSGFLDGWPMFNGSVLAFRDANILTGIRGIEQWINKGKASDLQGYIDALASIGNPVFHEIAADRNGEVFYGELSAIPYITQAQLDTCVNGIVGPLLADATTNVIISLDGSTSECEWGDDPEAPEGSNLYGASQLPQLRTRDYVGNSNNSYWLSNAQQPIEGFPTIMGPVGYEGQQQFLRTRIGHLMVEERKLASDGLSDTPLFDLETIKGLMYANRVYGAEVTLDDVLEFCESSENEELSTVCGVLARWDRRVDVDSQGAQVFTELWKGFGSKLGGGFQGVIANDTFWRINYDPSDPLNTPAGIDLEVASNQTLLTEVLLKAEADLTSKGVALDAPWSEVQYLQRNNDNVPIHGGSGTMGVYGAISARLSEGGYVNPGSGNSYIQAVTWDESECPIADVILVPSQSTDPASPHFSDQTKLYADKRWVRFPFCEEDIAASQIGETVLLQE